MQWNMLVILQLHREDVSVRLVFRRGVLSLRFRSSAAVLFDIRLRSESKPSRYRIKCILCPDVARNRGTCVHENETLKYIALPSSIIDGERAEFVADSDGPSASDGVEVRNKSLDGIESPQGIARNEGAPTPQ